MNIVVRVDASRDIGTGHVVRCRTLADELRRRGASVSFVMRAHRGHLAEAVRAAGFPVSLLPPPAAGVAGAEGPYDAWLGAAASADAAETIATLGSARPDWLIVDHYAVPAAWEERLRGHVGRLLAIDDLGRPHAADVLLDQNYSADSEGRYRDAALAGMRRLLGPRYALLQPAYAAARAAAVPRRDAVRRIVLFFGGADPGNVTGLALAALDAPAFAGIAVDVVVGSSNPHRAAIAAQAAARPQTALHVDVPSLAGLFAAADLALGAGGGTMWERCCLGLPALVVSIAENQVPASRDLDRAGVVRYLGGHRDLSVTSLRTAVAELVADAPARRAMAERGWLLVDGLGTRRVAELVRPTPAHALRLRPAVAADCHYYFALANDPAVRRQSFHSEPIAWATHQAWFAARLASPATRLFVLDADGLPVGQIRFDCDADEAAISYALDPLVRGRGWGTRLVGLGLERMLALGAQRIRAEVKPDNAASIAVFERLGFARLDGPGAGKLTYVIDKAGFAARSSDPPRRSNPDPG